MDKTAIKNYAIWARVQLIESCKQRAFEYGVTEDGNYASNLKTIGSCILTDQEVEQRNQLISQIQQKGYVQVMEESAYTWFNRFIALRFMEVNGYLPSKVRVFTDETGAFKPEILKEAMTVDLEGIDRSVVIDLLEKQDNEALYKYLLITQCNALSTGLPYMFEKISNWTELLFPANLLRNDSVVGRMVTDIPEENWTDAVQIIGWLYQYYNSELKDETFALLKKNVKITKERIPAATQLFTPDWIVRYMVENSLGRLWYEGHKDFDKSQWEYYLDEAEQEPEVESELAKIRAEYSQIKPEEIKVIDPCMGSGHILVYAFDVLMQIYISAGWSERDAARSIIENNLYGLDIDDRAGQLAYFAVMMKARKYNRRIMSLDINPNVMSIQDSSFITSDLIDFVAGSDAGIKADLRKLKEVFTDAKEYGSILKAPLLGYEAILERIDELQNSFVEDIFQTEYRAIAQEQLQPLIKQAVIMSHKYDAVVTNPPYMGSGGMSSILSEYIKKYFPDSKSDLFSVFIERCAEYVKERAYQAMITQHSWMFLSSYEKMRQKLQSLDIVNMVHLGARAFEEIAGEVVQTTAFIFRRTKNINYRGVYCRLIEPTSQQGKETMFLSKQNRYCTSQTLYQKIPGEPVAYWVSKQFVEAYEAKPLSYYGDAKSGLQTGNNELYLRLWFEVYKHSIAINMHSKSEYLASGLRWTPQIKGGGFRRWYGNIDYIVDWENDGEKIRNDKSSRLNAMGNDELFFREGLTWSHTTSSGFGVRFLPEGFLFNVEAPTFFPILVNKYYALGLLNSCVAQYYMNAINSTIHYLVGNVIKLPVIIDERISIEELTVNNIHIAKEDWDSFETSWDFKKHPLV